MATTERIYTIPLRRGTMLAPRTRRAKKAIFVLRDFVAHHMKSEDISISQALNEHIWQNGMRNPIMKVTVACTKDDKNKVVVRLATEKVQPEASTKTDKKAAKAAAHKDETKSEAQANKAAAKAESSKTAPAAPAPAKTEAPKPAAAVRAPAAKTPATAPK